MHESPLVTVICLCYNHERFVELAVRSVIEQKYEAIQIILVDDGSTDQSPQIISRLANQLPQIETLLLKRNIGNCKAFNKALAIAKGEYIIDFAADDILLPVRISQQVECFQALSLDYGVIFGDCQFISEEGELLHTHYKRNTAGQLTETVPSGDVYKDILSRYFICTPTMMIRKSVLNELNGYDELLSYEDFDFWVRSSRNWLYHYQDEILTHKRVVEGSLSGQFYTRGKNKLLASTLVICRKALALNKTPEENLALAKCIKYHLRQSFFAEDFALVSGYAGLLKKIQKPDALTQLFVFLAALRVPSYYFYKLYKKLKGA